MQDNDNNIFRSIEDFLNTIQTEKSASDDPGTTHPVKNAPNGEIDATEGARSSENEADIKKGEGVSDASPENNAGDSDKETDSQGTESQAADEMKGNVDGSPEMAPNTGTRENVMKAAADMSTSELANQILADVAVMTQDKQASAETTEDNKKASASNAEAAADGYKAAEAAAGALGLDKEAQVKEAMELFSKTAHDDGIIYSDFLKGYAETMQKRAMGEELGLEGAELPEGGMEEGMPEEGMEEGGGADEAELEELAAALDEAGVTPEELAAALEGEAGMEGGEEGIPPEAAAEAGAEGEAPAEEMAEEVAEEAPDEGPMAGEAEAKAAAFDGVVKALGESVLNQMLEEKKAQEAAKAEKKAAEGTISKGALLDAIKAAVNK